MSDVNGQEAAFPDGISSGFAGVVGGYFGGPNAYHIWPANSWLTFRSNPKLPIWVAGFDGEGEGNEAASALQTLGVPRNVPIAVDMETRVDDSYLLNFGTVMHRLGWLVFIYGSLSTVFNNRPLNGYWPADWGEEHMAKNPNTGNSIGIRGTQWATGPEHTSSIWKPWVVRGMWR